MSNTKPLDDYSAEPVSFTPTPSFTITTNPDSPRHPFITFTGLNALQAHDLLTQHPGTLHIKSLVPRLHAILAASSAPTSIAALHTHFPHSTLSQIQRALRQQVQSGTLLRVGRGLYSINLSS